MDQQQHIDHAEHAYWADRCPICEEAPCPDPVDCEEWANARAARVERSYLRQL